MSAPELSPTEVTGAILAGGQSRRMGRDKATLLFAGQTMAARIEGVLRQVCGTVLIAGDRPDLSHAGLRVVPDLFPGSSLGGLHGALSAATTPWLLAVACDVPLVSVELLRALLARRADYDIVVPRGARGVEPLCALYARATLPGMERRLLRGELAIQGLFAEYRTGYLDVRELAPDAERLLRNFNTPDDLAAFAGPDDASLRDQGR